MRANSSNTMCWYSVSVPNFAAWNSRSPFHWLSAMATPGVRTTPGSTQSLAKEMSPLLSSAWTVALVCAIRRSCSEWKICWMRGQPEVLVQPSVAGDLVLVQQLVVVEPSRGTRCGTDAVSASGSRKLPVSRVNGVGGRCLVVDEAAAGGERLVSDAVDDAAGGDRSGEVAFDQALRSLQRSSWSM